MCLFYSWVILFLPDTSDSVYIGVGGEAFLFDLLARSRALQEKDPEDRKYFESICRDRRERGVRGVEESVSILSLSSFFEKVGGVSKNALFEEQASFLIKRLMAVDSQMRECEAFLVKIFPVLDRFYGFSDHECNEQTYSEVVKVSKLVRELSFGMGNIIREYDRTARKIITDRVAVDKFYDGLKEQNIGLYTEFYLGEFTCVRCVLEKDEDGLKFGVGFSEMGAEFREWVFECIDNLSERIGAVISRYKTKIDRPFKRRDLGVVEVLDERSVLEAKLNAGAVKVPDSIEGSDSSSVSSFNLSDEEMSVGEDRAVCPLLLELQDIVRQAPVIIWQEGLFKYEYPGAGNIINLGSNLYVLNDAESSGLRLSSDLVHKVASLFDHLRLVSPKGKQGIKYYNGHYYLKMIGTDKRILFRSVRKGCQTLLVMNRVVNHKVLAGFLRVKLATLRAKL